MTASGSNIDFILKTVYSPDGVKDLENMEDVTWNKLAKSDRKIGGLGFQFPVKTKGNQANLGATNENEANPTGGNQFGDQGLIQDKIVKQAVRFSGRALEVAKSQGEEAYASTLTFQLDAGIRDHVKELNQEAFRDGSGVIAKVNGAVSASTDVVVDNGIITHFRVGMKLAAYNGSTREVESMEVESVDESTNTVTMTAAVTLTDNDNLYRYIDGVGDTKSNAPTAGKEISGLKLVTDNGTISTTYENIDRTSVTQFSGLSLDYSSANLSDDALHRAVSRVKVVSGFQHGPGKTLIVSNVAQFRKYMSVVTPQIRYNANDKLDSTGTGGYAWMGIDWSIDTDCGFDEIYMLDKEDVKIYTLYETNYDDTDGKILKYVGGADAFYAYSKSYNNIGSEQPNHNIRLYGLAEPTY